MSSSGTEKCRRLALVACPLPPPSVLPLALPSLAAYVAPHGYDVRCWDLSLDLQDLSAHLGSRLLSSIAGWRDREADSETQHVLASLARQWAERILCDQPAVVGFSVNMASICASLLIAAAIKELDAAVVTVFGGPECSYSWKTLIRRSEVDYVVLGEGEKPLLELLTCIAEGRHAEGVVGLVCKDRASEPQPAINPDLNQLPFPDYTTVPVARYTQRGAVQLPLYASIGCTHRCSFCSRRFLHETYRAKLPQRVVAEVERAVTDFGATQLYFVDSLINAQLDYLAQWTSQVVRRGINAEWIANATLDPRMSSELLTTMRQAGCRRLSYGLESGSPALLRDMRKYSNMPAIERVIRDTHTIGIAVLCFLIVGYPTEADADFDMTLAFLERNRDWISAATPTLCHVGAYTPLSFGRARYGIVGSGDTWRSRTSTLAIRQQRLQRLLAALKELQIPVYGS